MLSHVPLRVTGRSLITTVFLLVTLTALSPPQAASPGEPTEITDCDRLAAHPQDPHKVAEGVPFGRLDGASAARACREVLKKYPNNARYQAYYGRALMKLKQYDEALPWLQRAAAQGYALAQVNLGVLYERGWGVPKDHAQALEWYRKAADQGHAPAQYALGLLYESGLGVAKDSAEGQKWRRKATDQGYRPPPGAGPPVFVLIDTSERAYTIFQALPPDLPESELEKLRSQVAQKKGLELVPWNEFLKKRKKLLKRRVLKDEYPGSGAIDGIVQLIGLAPGIPWGLTWNGGIALTRLDYRHAEATYAQYKNDPEEYERTRNRDPRLDPVNPKGHLGPLLGR